MDVAIVDIGSNTARLLVAAVSRSGEVMQLRRERHYLRLGDDVHALGYVGPEKLAEAGKVARRFARIARREGVKRLETIVTAPGRQASNGEELIRVLEDATDGHVSLLTGVDEGRLAWEGAVARAQQPPDVVAVVDLGGGSCELAVGTPTLGPAWVRTFDLGALRVTRSYLGDGDPPTLERVRDARAAIAGAMVGMEPPRPDAAIVVGGTARALGRVVGRRFDHVALEELAADLTRRRAKAVTSAAGVTPDRARTLLGGTLVLAELARRLHKDFEVGKGGLREGAALALARAEAVAA